MAVHGQARLNITDECTVLVNWEGTERTANFLFFFAAELENQQNKVEATAEMHRYERNQIFWGIQKKLYRKSDSDL